MKEVLIVIASFADGYLDDLLKSIKENTTDVTYSIQVVDNHRDKKKLEECVIPICKKHKVELYLDTKITGYGDALNTGVNISDIESKYILYMDSDTLVSKGWLRELIDCFKRHKKEDCMMVGPLVKDFNNNYLPGVNELYGKPDDIKEKDILLKDDSYLIGVCVLRERETLPLFQWDKNYIRAYYEDNDLTKQVNFLNGKIYVAGKSLMFHKVNSSHETMKTENINPSSIGAFNRYYFTEKWKTIYENIYIEDIHKLTLGYAFKREIPEDFK